ncbi:MAG: HAMP domain-containing histidine kinase [Bacteroidetes bacterium]|nr:HAMP domain-containing histidine kinase [Bacteroidota bacterium]
MKRQQLIWAFTWVIVLFIFTVFSWWMFALLNYGRIEMDLRRQLMANQSRVAENLVKEQVLRGMYDSGQVTEFRYEKGIYRANVAMMGEVVARNSEGVLRLNIHDGVYLDERIRVDVAPTAIEEVYDRFQRRRNLFIVAGGIMSALVMAAFIWLLLRFHAIMNFNQQQNNFLLAVTHELKTPVAAVKLAMQTLRRHGLRPDHVEELKSVAENNANRLDELMNNVIVASRIEGRVYQFERAPVNLSLLLEKVRVQALFPGFAGEMILEIEPELYVSGDEASLQLAFSNLINNAIKYSGGAHAKVHISGNYVHGGLEIRVADQGPGIPKSEKTKIFQKFYRVGDERVRNSKGTGLGLYLVRKILLWHKAKIRVEDNKPGGAVFRVLFRQ